MATAIRVPLGPASYDVLVGRGLLGELPDLLQRHCPASRYALIADATVAERYGRQVAGSLAGGPPVLLLTFPAGEASKTRDTWSTLTDQMLAAGVGRDGAVVALGGGVTGDLAGFVAATYHRGIPVVQVPTTLLAMIDSSIGGKTGVDTPAGKNLVGAFHQPRLVVADVETLGSLPRTQLVAGMAEALKHGAIADREYFDRLLRLRDDVLRCDPDTLATVVARSVEIKAQVVGEDERETSGRRAVLNFGHTIGHAVETAAEYRMLHGEAIAIGMGVEAELGERLGITERGEAARLIGALERYGLPTALPRALAPDQVLALMRQDKKARAGTVRASLLRRIGEAARDGAGEWTIPLPQDLTRTVLEQTR